jgi:hypothetical protein
MYTIIFCSLFVLLACNSSRSLQADADKEVATRNMITQKRFIFRATAALPSGGASRQLTSEYDLRVSPDTIITYLPYFGRAYSAPLDMNDGGIKFTSTQFDYTTQEQRKGGWNISIIPRDANDVRQLLLNISSTGFASLQVISRNRQTISFNGSLIPAK